MSRTLSQLYSTAFVTGASSGLGLAFAEMLLAEGVRVWGTARDTVRLASLEQKYPGLFTSVALDLAKPEAAQTALENAAGAASATGTTADALGVPGCFDIVINNAGYGVFAPFSSVGFDVWHTQIDTMLTTTTRLAYAAFRAMLTRNRGCLVNVSSVAVDFPLPYMSGYNIAKAGLSALSESLIFEARGTNVTVIDFRPADHCTAFNKVMRPTIASGVAAPSRADKAWRTIDTQFNSGPTPDCAASDLRRALLRRRPGTIRSGSFFQTVFAQFIARLIPRALMRTFTARYFGAP